MQDSCGETYQSPPLGMLISFIAVTSLILLQPRLAVYCLRSSRRTCHPTIRGFQIAGEARYASFESPCAEYILED